MTMTESDVDLDLEQLWELDPFEVFLTPTRGGKIVLPEKKATPINFRGKNAMYAEWQGSFAGIIVDGCIARMGDKRVSLPSDPHTIFETFGITVSIDEIRDAEPAA